MFQNEVSKYFTGIFCVQILGCNEVDPLFKPRADGQVLQRTSGGYLHNLDFPALPYMTGTVRAEFGTFKSPSQKFMPLFPNQRLL